MKAVILLLFAAVGNYLPCNGEMQQLPLDIIKILGVPQPIYTKNSTAGDIFGEKLNLETFNTSTIARFKNITGARIKTVCKINAKDIGSPHPLYLKPGTATFWPLTDLAHMTFGPGTSVELFCTKTYEDPVGKAGSLKASCVKNSVFLVAGRKHDLSKVLCSSWPNFIARKTNKTCSGGVVVETGFPLRNRFVKQLEICFNEDIENTRYVYHQLEPASDHHQIGIQRLNFATAGFFNNRDIDKLYTQSKQLQTFTRELGSVASDYIDIKKNMFLARGHMAAKADFFFGTLQRGTFLFLNAAPQWQTFNNGNWQRVEDNVRSWVSKNNKHVDCYTGTYGITTLPNANGVETKLYLDYDVNHNGVIPVPMLYFRVIIEPSTERGIVFIGVNNPYLSLHQIEKDYILCPDVSEKVTWMKWNRTNIQAGYSYVCEVPEFVKKNPNLPKLRVNGLLL